MSLGPIAMLLGTFTTLSGICLFQLWWVTIILRLTKYDMILIMKKN